MAPSEEEIEQHIAQARVFLENARLLQHRLRGRPRSEPFVSGSIAPELLRRVEDEFELGLPALADVIQALSAARDQGRASAWKPDREAVARIIHPRAFLTADDFLKEKWCSSKEDALFEVEFYEAERRAAFARADAILALPPASAGSVSQERGEGREQ